MLRLVHCQDLKANSDSLYLDSQAEEQQNVQLLLNHHCTCVLITIFSQWLCASRLIPHGALRAILPECVNNNSNNNAFQLIMSWVRADKSCLSNAVCLAHLWRVWQSCKATSLTKGNTPWKCCHQWTAAPQMLLTHGFTCVRVKMFSQWLCSVVIPMWHSELPPRAILPKRVAITQQQHHYCCVWPHHKVWWECLMHSCAVV